MSGSGEKESEMKILASILVLGASLAAFPALADSTGPVGASVILTGGAACVGPLCVGRDRDRDWRYRHHGYAYERGGCGPLGHSGRPFYLVRANPGSIWVERGHCLRLVLGE